MENLLSPGLVILGIRTSATIIPRTFFPPPQSFHSRKRKEVHFCRLWEKVLLNQTWVCSPDAQQSQSIDTELCSRKIPNQSAQHGIKQREWVSQTQKTQTLRGIQRRIFKSKMRESHRMGHPFRLNSLVGSEITVISRNLCHQHYGSYWSWGMCF